MVIAAAEIWLVAYCVHLGLFSASAAIYALWSARWLRRRRFLLAVIHAIVAGICAVVVWEFLVPLATPNRAVLLYRRNLWDVIWSTAIVVLPAVARLLELRREAAQDVRAEIVQDALGANGDFGRA